MTSPDSLRPEERDFVNMLARALWEQQNPLDATMGNGWDDAAEDQTVAFNDALSLFWTLRAHRTEVLAALGGELACYGTHTHGSLWVFPEEETP